ncbi:hypothetical protein [Streptomyces roseoverticillatus]|uniref:hypothetical protein n=1 Tax=Streptomyces roseoverticillatus TaxID=66429 RepID=UPI0004BFE788|nr:hypothetical protein [Streptomyces roseoverticillatus]
MSGERELEKYIGLSLARWRGRLFEAGHSERSGAIWLTALDGDDELGELASGVRWGKPARLVSLDELSEKYDVAANCTLDGVHLSVTKIDGDTVHVWYSNRGENAFTRAHGLVPQSWDYCVGEVDRAQLDSLEVERRELLEPERAHAGLVAVFGEDLVDLNRSWCRRPADARPWLGSKQVPSPYDFSGATVKMVGEPRIQVPVEELESWTICVAYAFYDGHEVCVDSTAPGYTATICTADAAWAEAEGMGPTLRGWHPVYWPQLQYWKKKVQLTELTDFRAERLDVLARIAARGTRHAANGGAYSATHDDEEAGGTWRHYAPGDHSR